MWHDVYENNGYEALKKTTEHRSSGVHGRKVTKNCQENLLYSRQLKN